MGTMIIFLLGVIVGIMIGSKNLRDKVLAYVSPNTKKGGKR